MTLGEKIKMLRAKFGFTQKDLADKIHVTFQTISKWENNENEPDIATLRELAKLFECSIDYLLSPDAEEAQKETEEVAVVASAIAAVAQAKDQEAEVTLVHKCADCHKTINDGEPIHEIKRGSNNVEVCESCWQEHLKIEDQLKKIGKDSKKAKHRGASDGYRSFFERDDHVVLIWSIIIGVVALAITLILMIVFREKVAVGWIIGAPLIVGFGLFADIYCMFTGTWVADVFIEISSWSIRLPGIIFSFDLDGLAFLIVMKILFAIIGFFVGILTFLFAVLFSSICSIFTFPFVIGKNKTIY